MTHAREHAELMHSASLIIICQFALVSLAILGIHLLPVVLYHKVMHIIAIFHIYNICQIGLKFCVINSYILVLDIEPINPCSPSPCGANAICQNGACSCIPEYHGDPYLGCQPECVLNSDCPRNKACIRNKCSDPCKGTCGAEALCEVINHIPMCSCPPGHTGSPFLYCTKILGNY